ncbi:MAG: hypothetical protein H0X37_11095 [Herpetosiphonaceae bacterium]|nr:hypothetical protein [Herpetosiphonaceae bacterium]
MIASVPTFGVVLDASVLFPAAIRDTLLRAAATDDFLTQLFKLVPELMVQIVIGQAAALRSPPKTHREVLDSIAKQAPTFASLIVDKIGSHTQED